ncbi:MAG TPA: tRNA guanosine(34) transglycosylase Tgt [Phycisphaerales bacterium]|nr:tRNA guanosine(34) transglycosylase Tgt [Phycisphaerales bacterium]HIB00551.1 tRNA guanosine(34) transglycosylase Tgt [Phycisphaerales bacterium]HIN83510.1 tRNA guanosine(34) transglycosylase Tgt [Phycisphaerales bacterium]HIO52053.1 tRNA guanosine(34) transglycosylase Tgt [Phycisphaerales bacterium]
MHHKSKENAARTGTVTTPHGSFRTPAFMPVGTRGTVKGLTPQQIRATGSDIILNNAFHLMLRPTDKRIAELGGVHAFMKWNRPILTDSGGYQAWSMADINTIDEDGVTFKSYIDGATIRMTPEFSIEIQNNLGADIIMAFDDCPSSVEPQSQNLARRRHALTTRDGVLTENQHELRLLQSLDRTARWLERCDVAHQKKDIQALFGIVQGGVNLDLRARSVEQVCNVDLPGYAIGGVAVGESPEKIVEVVKFTANLLPEEKPRYLMGVGYERDLVAAVASGMDMFDCVLPTRNARNAHAFTKNGHLNLRNACFKDDIGVIEEGCTCASCAAGNSRAYLAHLFKCKEMLGGTLLSIHNIHHFQSLMIDIRLAIEDNSWSALPKRWPVLTMS